ncbi:rap guanine nucleotide exchange factor 4-like isoform X1 [Varroa jacobsoni]|uniref:rap guanine nucleotide exchange factor 4-like isoform X1 n=1 Tax=Varroa jacobsoni TaxID=62625 RepID=UPI000BF38C32|nr:rap guanine nucleotide exchange factor 4-like isoform X1 [Varroa jacobsoni]
MPPFHRLHPLLLQQLAYYGYYEDIDAGVTLFREGDKGKNWYAVLKGSLDVQITNNIGASMGNVTLCTLGVGRAFGESVSCLSSPHSATVVANECCELLRIDQKDFQMLWERNGHLMEDIVSPLSTLRGITQHHIGQGLASHQGHPGHPRQTTQLLMNQSARPPLSGLGSLQPDYINSSNQPEPFRRASTNSVRLPGEQFQLNSNVGAQQPTLGQQQAQDTGSGELQQANPQHSQVVTSGSTPAATSFYHPNGKGPPQQSQQQQQQQQLQPVARQQQERQTQQLNNAQQIMQQHLQQSQQLQSQQIQQTPQQQHAPQLLRDCRVNQNRAFRRCMVGTEMVDWLLHMGSTHVRLSSRAQAAGMWQVLLEEGCINHVTGERQFEDKYLFYRFREDDTTHPWLPTSEERNQAECELQECLVLLMQLAPDANLRMILRKPPSERRKDDLDTIYEELTRIKALSHLSNSVKRELSGVMVFESHPKRDTVLFNQGDEGKSWYIILKGSVNVAIYGKGVVCVLHEGDDFGKLALVNDAPRAATIVTREENCHFLRVDKHDFNRILRDVEANTVRLKEHGQDVLVLQKTSPQNQEVQTGSPIGTGPAAISNQTQAGPNGQQANNALANNRNNAIYNASHYKYTVMAGTPQKMLEHLLETRIGERGDEHQVLWSLGGSTTGADSFLEDFLLTHVIFMPSHELCPELMKHYRLDSVNQRQDREFILSSKRRVVHFTAAWAGVVREPFYQDPVVQGFLEELSGAIEEDQIRYPGHYLIDQKAIVQRLFDIVNKYRTDPSQTSGQKWKVDAYGQIRHLSSGSTTTDDTPTGPNGSGSTQANNSNSGVGNSTSGGNGALHDLQNIRPFKENDEIIFRVYCADHTYVTLKTPIIATADQIKRSATEKTTMPADETILVEVKSTGERLPFNEAEVSVATGLSINGRLFIVPIEHLDSLTPVAEQNPFVDGTANILESLSSQDIAYHMAVYEWKLFTTVHEYELIYQVFGRNQFRRGMSNLDMFQRRFNIVQFWVVTEMCQANSLSRRVQLLKKFIKIAQHCREYQNLNSLFAIVMGLGNQAVSRLSQTWERLPSKLRRTFEDLENLIDPSRNHKRYRSAVAKLQPPLIPFMPLLLKDMTFCHLGNKTYIDGLVNFEKMHMIGQTLRHLRYARSQRLGIEHPHPQAASKTANHNDVVADYVRNLKVIDNQRTLSKLSNILEPRRP